MQKVSIIGAGIIGMLSAHLLAKKGVEVTLIEQGYAGKESTWAGGGIISPLYPWRYDDSITKLAIWGQKHYPKLLEQIKNDSGIDPEYIQSGLLYLNIEEELNKAQAWMDKFCYSFITKNQNDVKKIESALSTQFKQAWQTPNIGQVRNPRLVKSLQEIIKTNPLITLHEQTQMRSLVIENDIVKGVKTNSSTFYSDKVIIAGGAWSAKLLNQYGHVPRIAPVKGQMIVFKAPENLIKHIILSKGRYVIPRKDGRIVMGSTLEFNEFDKTTDQQTQNELQQEAVRIIPELANYPIEKQWAGLRPGSIDGIPYIGEHPEIKNCYINAGHFRNGVVIGYASCELLKNQLLGEENIVPPSPYELTSSRLLNSSDEIDLAGAM